MPFSIELEGFEELAKQFSRFEDTSPRILQEGIAQIIRDDIAKRFLSSPSTASGGEVYGGVFWRKLTDSYLQQRPDRSTGQVLIDTGLLKDSLTIPGSPYSYVSYGSDTIEIGTELTKANELNRTWQIIFFHTVLIERIADFITQYYMEGKETPDEF